MGGLVSGGMDTSADTADDAVDDAAGAKTALRARIRLDRTHRLPDRDARDGAVLDHLTAELDRRDRPGPPRAVAAYDPLPGEPGSSDLPESLASTGREVWLPVVAGPGTSLRWVKWRGVEHTRSGAFGIREPVPAEGDTPVNTGDLLTRVHTVIIPALAVGNDGARSGQGGGFYDRTFAASMSTGENHDRLIAVVDHEEFGVAVPATAFDITVDVVVTDSGTFRTDIADGSVRP